jgi:hypothetical protein
MGDPRRFDLFAKFIANLVPPGERGEIRVADVAAGKGALSWALREHGFRRITPFEPAPRRGGQVRRLGIRVEDFEPSFARDFDLLVGMHPDAATDCILSGAALYRRMAVISPCCVKPNAWSFGGRRNSRVDWHRHLLARSKEEGLHLEMGELRMTGANRIMWGGSMPKRSKDSR